MDALAVVLAAPETLVLSRLPIQAPGEADITVAPLFAGTATTPRTSGLDAVARLDLVHLLTADGYVMARYVRVAALSACASSCASPPSTPTTSTTPWRRSAWASGCWTPTPSPRSWPW